MQKPIKYNKLIIVVSIIVPLVVAVLASPIGKLNKYFENVWDLSFLPPIYASINGLTALILISALIAIKNKKILLHSLLMKCAIVLSLVFLVMYIAYHMTSESTPFGGEGTIRYIYFTILISHILLSITVIPFVLVTYVRAITNDIQAHKKIAKITFPLWLYVAVTGVVVYIMISPYY